MIENYKGDLVSNLYLFSETHPGTRRLLRLNSTSLRATRGELELELALGCVSLFSPPLVFIEGANGGISTELQQGKHLEPT